MSLQCLTQQQIENDAGNLLKTIGGLDHKTNSRTIKAAGHEQSDTKPTAAPKTARE